jgi:hypothetical protein
MLYCHACKIWVQPIQWIDAALSGHAALREACPSCRQTLPQPERTART